MLANLLEFEFLRNTFLTGIIIGIIAPLLGAFIVVRRLSLIADALSHVTLAGIAFGLLMEKKDWNSMDYSFLFWTRLLRYRCYIN